MADQQQSDDSTDSETTVDRVAAATGGNLRALTPVRILALFTIAGFLYLGVELGNIGVPYPLGLLGFVYFAIAAVHAWNRGGEASGVDAVVAGHILVGVVVVGAELGVLNVPGVAEWAQLLILGLIVGDGFVVHRTGGQ